MTAPGFDTVIVGAGSAGAVLAARLTESGRNQVLLIEAGPDVAPDPSGTSRSLRDGRFNSYDQRFDWGYAHQPTPGQITMPMPRGRVLGGSSAVNTCIALRGTPADFDEWEARGATGWSWRECLPFFQKLERDLDVGQPGIDGQWHGTSGPVPLRRPTVEELSPWQRGFGEACLAEGFPLCPDTNAPDSTGYGRHACNRIEGERWSAARSYLTAEVRARPGFHLWAQTFVRRVTFSGRICDGLEVERLGQVQRIRARRVVLSGGVIDTPAVLLRSGVGPSDAVARVGATLVAEVPAVGSRLLDHPGAALFFIPWGPGAVDLGAPLIQNVLRVPSAISGLPNDIQMQAGAYAQLPWTRLPLVSLMANVGKTRGAGALRFDGFDPHAKPTIDSKLLEDPLDLDGLVEALQLAERLSMRGPLRDLAFLAWPPRRVVRDREQFRRAIARLCGSSYHPCGTVPMGGESDPHAATDPRGRVKSVEGLYVADGSLMPTIPRANLNLSTLMMGERLASWLDAG